jgi:glyoxylase-like metal-dependent hydrolase (beta-lactamase superfamily II)
MFPRLSSHLHWDHTGDLTPFSTASTLIVGGEAQQNLENGYPKDPKSMVSAPPEGMEVIYVDFDVARPLSSNADTKMNLNIVGSTSFRELVKNAPLVSPIGTFQKGIDLFQDGSLYILSAPGHYPGKIIVSIAIHALNLCEKIRLTYLSCPERSSERSMQSGKEQLRFVGGRLLS